MTDLRHIASEPIPSTVVGIYEDVVGALGSEAFGEHVAQSVRRLAHVDRLYLFDLHGMGGGTRILLQFHERDKPPIAHQTYVRHYLPTDPIQRAIRAHSEGMIQVRVEPRDIVASGYRSMLEHAGIRERVSFLRRANAGWQCMTVARKTCSGAFDDRDLLVLGGFARLLMPLMARNEALSDSVPQSDRQALEEIESRFRRMFPKLTVREMQACSRAAIGMTASDAADDLGIKLSSVQTYRKRAYARLGVTSAFEVARLVLR